MEGVPFETTLLWKHISVYFIVFLTCLWLMIEEKHALCVYKYNTSWLLNCIA